MVNYKNIQTWQRAHALAIALHKGSARFGRAGQTHLRSQLSRAAASIATNIVEGSGAESKREFARYLDIAIKSANETEYHLLTARDLNLISSEAWHRHSAEAVEIRKMLFGYRRKLL